jgi:hypothetical protein
LFLMVYILFTFIFPRKKFTRAADKRTVGKL